MLRVFVSELMACDKSFVLRVDGHWLTCDNVPVVVLGMLLETRQDAPRNVIQTMILGIGVFVPPAGVL